jgi:uncharacterized protein
MPNTRTNAPRGALVFDMRLLGRQAGNALTQTRTVPAPGELRLELVGVPVGADAEVEVRFEAVSEGVLATGTVTAPLAGECARCLAPLTNTVTASFQELYLYPEDRHDKHGKHDHRDKHDRHDKYEEDEEDDDELRYLDGDLLDLEPALRDAVVLALPMSPLCRDDCPGLCAECGAPLAEAGPDHGHDDATDPRWAALEKIEKIEKIEKATNKAPNQDRRTGAIDLQEG